MISFLYSPFAFAAKVQKRTAPLSNVYDYTLTVLTCLFDLQPFLFFLLFITQQFWVLSCSVLNPLFLTFLTWCHLNINVNVSCLISSISSFLHIHHLHPFSIDPSTLTSVLSSPSVCHSSLPLSSFQLHSNPVKHQDFQFTAEEMVEWNDVSHPSLCVCVYVYVFHANVCVCSMNLSSGSY